MSLKRFFLTILFFIILIVCFGCSKGKNIDKENTIIEYFHEQTLSLPDSLLVALDIYESADSTQYLIGKSKKTDGFLWISKDEGKTWKEEIKLPEELNKSAILNAIFVNDNNIFCIMDYDALDANDNPELNDIRCYLVSKNGVFQEKKLDILQEGFYNIQYKDNAVYGRTAKGTIKSYDYNTGELLLSFDNLNIFTNFMCIVNDTILAIGADDVETFDINSGELLETNSTLKEQLLEISTRNQDYYSHIAYNSSNGKLYFACLDGVYEFDLEKNTSRLVLSGQNHKFSKINSYLTNFTAVGETLLFISYVDIEHNCEVAKYIYVPEGIESNVAAKEVVLYSVEKNSSIQDIVTSFNASQNEVYVAYNFGTSGQDAKTKIDAVNNLNVEIMAGNGPDLLLLDGLSADVYIERDLFCDVSNILKQDKYFKNITTPFRYDNKIYALPIFFKLMGIHADKEIVNSMSSLETLTTAIIRKYENEDKKLVLDKWEERNYIDVLYHVYSQTLFNENGMIEQNKLENFYSQLMKLNSIAKFNWTVQEVSEKNSKFCDFSNAKIATNDWSEILLEMDELEVAISGVTGVQDLIKITSVRENDKTIGFDYFSKNDTPLFVPNAILALMQSSNYKEEALKFLEYCISEEAYNRQTDIDNGFPISETALENEFTRYKGYSAEYSDSKDETRKIELRGLSAKEKKDFIQMTHKLVEYSYTDVTLKKIILEEAENYINGKGALEQCASSAVEKINLYLKE